LEDLSTYTRQYWTTPDADPQHLYHDVLVAIDEMRLLNNGQPSFLVFLIEALARQDGDHVVHVGCGTGYYSAILAELVGLKGHVTALEGGLGTIKDAGGPRPRGAFWLAGVGPAGRS